MSVSHPLAADDSHANAGRDRQTTGRRDQATVPEVELDASLSCAAPRSILPEQVIVAPERLGLQTRSQFRKVASELIDCTTTGTGRLVIDCGCLRAIDSAGLNTLILVQRKASKRRIRVFLRDLDDELRALLVLTKLDDLFELQDGQSHQGV